MTEPVEQDDDEVLDPAWWIVPLEGVDDPQMPDVMAVAFSERLKHDDLGDLEREVVQALAVATSGLNEPDNWQEPFKPTMVWQGRRSAVPRDLTPDQVVLLAKVAPLVDEPVLRARVADVAWFYGDRGAVSLLKLAIEAYCGVPLDQGHWARSRGDGWRRALQLAKRLGKGRDEVANAIAGALREAILNSSVSDRYFVTQVSRLARTAVRLSPDVSRQLAEHLEALAAEARDSDVRLSRHCEREAAAWFGSCDEKKRAHGCIARVAETYVAAAMAADDRGALVAGREIEQAIKTIRTLPRSYRLENGLESRLEELLVRLEDVRQATLEAMVPVEGEPFDLSPYVAQARALVSGYEQFEALIRLAVIQPLIDKDKALREAGELSAGSISAYVSRETFSSDGRKVAASRGADDPGWLWTQLVRDFRYRVELMTAGFILPASEQLRVEHRYSLEFLTMLCIESPFVPPRHEQLWARGLWHGFNEDFPSAVSLLVPQLEQAIRFRLKLFGINTKVTNEATGVETEKGMGTLLVQDDVDDLLGSSLTTELRSLLVEQEGANLRNDIAHGLFSDDAGWSYSAVYCWWLMLRLVAGPVWHMRQSGDSQDSTDG